MERRSHKIFNARPKPTVFRKKPPKSVEEVKAHLRLVAELQKAVANG